jgi:ubiquinone/menaquinone biosynthesis C-methylase UbiE
MNSPQLSTLNHQYKNRKNTLTPFEIYLKYSNEKDVSVKQLHKILSNFKKDSIKILDVGSGDGSYLIESLPKNNSFHITSLEPSKSLYKKLGRNTKKLSNFKTTNQTFEEFYKCNDEKFDIVLASHLYHFPQEEYPIFISQLITVLNDKGTLIWIERGIDEITEFKKKYKTMLLPKRYPLNWIPRNYKRALDILNKKPGQTKLILNRSELNFPSKENLGEIIAIVEFYLNIDWITIHNDIQNEILDYIFSKKILKQEEGVLIYQKQ